MRISEPRIEPVPKRSGEMSWISKAVSALKPGESIEVDPFEPLFQPRVLMVGLRLGYKIKTRKTEHGTLKIWRLK